MALILTFAGIVLGALIAGAPGAVAGLAIGLLLLSASEFRKSLQAMREQLESLQLKVAKLEALAETDATDEHAPVAPVPEAQSEFFSRLAEEMAAIPGATVSPPARPETPLASPQSERLIAPADLQIGSVSTGDEARAPTMWERLIGGNVVAKVGVVLLFFGVGFLLKYAAERGFLPPELRLAGVALAGVAMLVFGWWQRNARKMFGVALQGGGVGLLYLAVFAALRLYGLIDEGPAFILFAVIGLFGVILALKQEAVSLAVLGISGAFLAPILASTGEGSQVVLFGYYVMLNTVILAISAFRSWRALNVTGFLFTFVIGLTWGARYYQPEFFASSEPFLIAFFLIYVAISILSARREPLSASAYLDGALIFGVPVIAFSLQWALVRDFEYGAALSAFALAVFYLALWLSLKARAATLAQAFAALSVLFLTLAIYYGFAPEQIIAMWALEGAALVWLGLKQERVLPRVAGLALQAIAALYFFDHVNQLQNAPPVSNSFFLSALIIAVSALASSGLLHFRREKLTRNEAPFIVPVLLWGLGWWYFAGLREIDVHALPHVRSAAMLAFVSLSCVAGELAATRIRFAALREQWWLLPAAMLFTAFHYASHYPQPLAHFGYVAWPLAFSAYYWALQRIEEGARPPALEARHLFALWLFAYLASWELAWIAERFSKAVVWPFAAIAIVPALSVFFIVKRGEQTPWPIGAHLRTYGLYGAGALAAFLCLWSLAANVRHSGDPSPFSYVPILNPLDLAQIIAFAALFVWRSKWAEAHELGRTSDVALFTLGLIWLSGVVARTIHHWAGVSFEFDALFESVLVQASLSLLWTFAALALMVYATRRYSRSIWIAGAALLALVTLKLFLVDLANTGTVERIVSFLGVGLLFLTIGYFSPVPPGAAKAT